MRLEPPYTKDCSDHVSETYNMRDTDEDGMDSSELKGMGVECPDGAVRRCKSTSA